MSDTTIAVGGPYFDDLTHGQVFDRAPAVTLTSGLSAAHQSILGDRLRLSLDHPLSAEVTGGETPLAYPGLVWDVAIGQSTLATHHVKANLFYRGLRFLRHPHLGDTLHTVSEVVGLRENRSRPGRAATGLAALHIVTTDQHGETVLDFHRCAMLPLSPDADPGRLVHADDLDAVGSDAKDRPALPPWDLSAYRAATGATAADVPAVGTTYSSSGDVVSSAPELARLTLNIAATHHDARVGASGRLVYGGHTIGLALAQTLRALPDLVTVLDWDSCDHTGPVHEGDTVTSSLEIIDSRTESEWTVLGLRCRVLAHEADGATRDVLDWRFHALHP